MYIRSIKEIKDVKGRRVLVRVDFNVPLENGKVKDDFKIKKTLPTIQYLIKKGAKVILVSHLGRPKGVDTKLSLQPVVEHLEKLLKQLVAFVKIGRLQDWKIVGRAIEKLKNGELAMLENIRFVKGEEDNDPNVAKALAALADIFVSDCFAVAHRDAASITGVAKYLPHFAGLLLFEEVSVLSRAMEKPKRPLVVLLGGAKVETKIPIVRHLLQKADYILVGGEIANTYWWAKGSTVGQSLVGKDFKADILKYCKNKKVVLPVDCVVGAPQGGDVRVFSALSPMAVPNDHGMYDIGPQTVELFSTYLKKAGTILWNGAMGKFEVRPYEKGTFALMKLLGKTKAFSIVGGGESVEILKKCGIINKINLVSTGGGAMLEFLGGKKLPGIEALKK
ncbi:MAG: phosphoglycerate kinase [Candidatus Magasanikbacteria bacterium]|nr:phosphoglycerate kinase [Candidatus Magasanikbacteria bacterium]